MHRVRWLIGALGSLLCLGFVMGEAVVVQAGKESRSRPRLRLRGGFFSSGGLRQSSRRWVARQRRVRQRLVGISYVSRREYTRVVLRVRGAVSGINHDYIPARDGFPPRVYIDLTPCIPLRRWSRRPHWIGDRLVGRVRVGRNTLRTTRVVFELRRAARYQVSILRRPMRLVLDFGDRRLPSPATRKSRLPTREPKVMNRRRPRLRWRSRRRLTTPDVLRHKGALPRLSFPFQVRRIAIDAGHGGPEDGAIGLSGLKEKVVTLDIAKRVVRLIRKRLRVKAFLTRRRDRLVSLSQRAADAVRRRADLLISIHINAHTNRKIAGISTYILDWSSRSFAAQLLSSDPLTARENQGVHPRRFGAVQSILSSLKRQSHLSVSRILAIAVQRGMLRATRSIQPPIPDLGVRKGLFYLLFAVAEQMPGVLVEASYISNRREERLLKTRRYRAQIARGIVDGLGRFLRHLRDSSKPRRRPLRRR